MDLTIVIPVYNSELILPKLISEIDISLKDNNIKKEIILVNDHSKDNSWKIIRQLSQNYDFIKGINLDKNYGQHNAIIAGLKFGQGNFFILMDDDFQHQPKYIIEIYNALANGYDVCYVKYLNRKHQKWKIFVSWLNNIVASLLAFKSIKIYTSSFKGFSKVINSKIINFRERDIFLDWLILSQTSNITIIKVFHNERLSGKTNYNLRRLLELWSIMILNILPKNFPHKLWLILPKFFVKIIVYPFVKKNNIKEQYKILEKTF